MMWLKNSYIDPLLLRLTTFDAGVLAIQCCTIIRDFICILE